MKKTIIHFNSRLWMMLGLLSAFALPGCLKDRGIAFPTNADTIIPIVELGNPKLADSYSSVYSLYSNSEKFDHDTAGFYVIVNYNGDSYMAPEDINVTLDINPAALEEYNTANSTSYLLMDETKASFPKTATIPKGASSVRFRVIVNDTTGFDFNSSYALPLTITSTSYGTVAKNTGTKLYSFVGQNEYQGDYTSTGYFYHPSSPRDLSATKTLVTINANTVKISVGDLGGSNYYAAVTINPDNTLTIKAADGAAGAPYTMFTSGLPATDPGYTPGWSGSAQCNNTYDPATKTFYLRYGYAGSTGWRVTEEIVQAQ